MIIKNHLHGRLSLLLAILLLVSLSNVKGGNSKYDLGLTFSNLSDPGDDHYEGWLIVDGNPVSTGKFSLDSTGKIVDLEGNSIDEFRVNIDLDLTTKFVLSLEPSGDTDTVPSEIKHLAGDLNSEKNAATIMHNIGVDLTSVAGSYILATPTDGANTNENSGIWFLDPTSGTPVAGLSLPDLSGTDWIYEGWVVINGTPVTTGTFDAPSGIDDDDPYSGTEAGPPFPGEDFLINDPTGLSFPTNVAGMVAVISIEPRMDNDPSPFQFKPLVGDIPVSATDHFLYNMEDKSTTLASGSLSITEVSDDDGIPGFNFTHLLVAFSLILVFRFSRKRM
ncbi:MAG: hypothetical protein ACW98K_05290 [Candidatus Kariarchaeaceae archaeon]|jgi:hypothetical protein